ncbi:MAG: M23 family metallopeptidase [Reichenbachiella sp.]|uniref:M23 family metallopeptidase n=1 Tax=Reichenbachiella sp. TaxID=2184521 RepID=UPI00326763E9
MMTSIAISQVKQRFLLSLMLTVFLCCGDSDSSEVMLKSEPPLVTDHNREYTYSIRSVSDSNSELVVIEKQIPSWLSFDPESNILSGTAGWPNVNESFPVKLDLQQGDLSSELSYSIVVELGEIVCDQEFGNPEDSPYVLPYTLGETYTFGQVYCSENPAWGHHNWFAYDIDMGNGTIVLASREGEIIATKEDQPNIGGDCSGGKENFVFILHDDGTVMSYVHFTTDGVLVETGDRVVQGQEIGLSGNSGCSSGPHTHVALFKDRTNFDRQSTIPFNYSNADGPLDMNQGLVLMENYTAR